MLTKSVHCHLKKSPPEIKLVLSKRLDFASLAYFPSPTSLKSEYIGAVVALIIPDISGLYFNVHNVISVAIDKIIPSHDINFLSFF